MTQATVPFGPTHPLAGVAARTCQLHDQPLIGAVACSECWELAIRRDERTIIEWDLPRDLESNPDDVDDIAVERACRGDRVPLTAVELTAAAQRLKRWGLHPIEIGRRLHITYSAAVTALERATSSPPTDPCPELQKRPRRAPTPTEASASVMPC